MKCWVVSILFVALLLYVQIVGLTCGSSVVVTGGGADANGPSPTIDSKSPSLPHSGDPSQYETPITPTIPNSSSTTSSATSNSTFSGGGLSTINFIMDSKVVGTSNKGPSSGFSEWRYINDLNGLKAKQASNALYGHLDESRNIIFLKYNSQSTSQNASSSAILLKDQIQFVGSSYNDRMISLNEGDQIENTFTSGAISKNSTYLGLYDIYNYNDELAKGSFNKTTIYRLDTRNVGITKLDLMLKSNDNHTTISEEYAGEIAIRMNINSSLRSHWVSEPDHWLPCCSGGFAGMNLFDQKPFQSAKRIFDCTCSTVPIATDFQEYN